MAEQSELVGAASSSEPAEGLEAVASLRVLLESLEELQVERARSQGWTWQQIANVLGVTKQAVHGKYGGGRRLLRRRRR